MEFQKIVDLLDRTSDEKDLPRFVTKKRIEVYDQSERDYRVNKEIRIKTPILRSDLCDFSDAYVVVKGDITVTDPDKTKRNEATAFKNNAPFINCISNIDGVQIDNAEDLDVVMPMYSLLEHSKSYKKTTGSLQNYYRHEPSNPPSTISESFKHKTSITGNTCNGNDANKIGKNEIEVVIPRKHLSKFWRTLNIPFINCEMELILTWSKNCVLADMAAANNPPTGLEFQITDTKLYVRVVTLSTENDKKILEQLKSVFKRTVKWNNYKSQMTVQSNNSNLNYFINPKFIKVIRLFVLSFQRIAGENNTTKDHKDSFFTLLCTECQNKRF